MSTASGSNYGAYTNTTVDSLYEAASERLDTATVISDLNKADSLLSQDA